MDEETHGIMFVDSVEKKKDATKWEDLMIEEWRLFGFGDKSNDKKTMLKLIADTKDKPLFPQQKIKDYRDEKLKQRKDGGV